MSLPGLQTLHKKPYPAISPDRPELSQKGRTILVTGGNRGIGFAIARAFMAARAKRVIIVSRRADSVQAAAARLAEEAKEKGLPTVAEGRVCDVADLDATASLWSDLKDGGIYVDTLVLNAASLGNPQPLLQSGRDRVWKDFTMNVRVSLDFAERFYNQEGQGAGGRKALVGLSTMAAYMRQMAPDRPSYGMTKLAGTDYLQQLALEVKPEEMQITLFHPGIIFTDFAELGGLDGSSYPWDDENLPGHYAVWAASPEAEFLHGRFAWAAWDVEELEGLVKDGLKKNPNLLRAGIEGLTESVN